MKGTSMASAKLKKSPRIALTNRQILAIAHDVDCDPSTVRRWAAGDDVLESTDARISRVVAKMGLNAAKVESAKGE
jgi:hypothetical protein